MSAKVMLSLLITVLGESFALTTALISINELEAMNGLPINSAIFVTASRFLLFIGTAFVVAITVIAVRRLARN